MDSTTHEKAKFAYQDHYDPGSSKDFTSRIIEGLEEIKDIPIEELPPLQNSIDLDSLETLFCPLSSGEFAAIGEVEFMYEDLLINIHSTGTIHMYQR